MRATLVVGDGLVNRSEPMDLRILHLEDNELDGELIRLSLEKGGLAASVTRVDTREAFVARLGDGAFDLIVSDFSLPGFDGLSALRLVRERDREVPFLFVSGTIGEEKAVAALRDGATDYILKDRLSRLPAAVRRCVAEREERLARRAAEDRIHEQAALLDEAREAIVVHSLERQVTYWSRGAEALFGWTAEEARAGAARSVIPPESRAEVDAAIATVCSGDKWDGTLALRTRDGRTLTVESHWTCLRHPDGRPRAILSINTDVTQARRLEAQLEQKQRLETIGMVAGGIAHDLNNVLAPIILGLGSLRRKIADEHGQRLIATMDTTAQRGAEILQQVLSFARGTPRPLGPVDVGQIVRGMEQLLVATLSSRIELDIDIAPDLARPSADPAQLQQILLNLCVNARDAMPEGGRLSIVVANGGAAGLPLDQVVIRVTDTGEGMPPEVQRRVFEPFYTTKAHGTGIGLATVHAIVKRHGGTIEVDSEVGRGTEFRVSLPMAAAPITGSFLPSPATGDGRLLVVVDEGAVREIARQTLEAYGYRVACPASAAELARVLADHPDEVTAAVVNVSLPELDAAEVMKELTTRAPAVKVIATVRAAALPADMGGPVAATLSQPYTPQKLVDTLARVLRDAG
jgi:PAS domain S-box-containing protein